MLLALTLLAAPLAQSHDPRTAPTRVAHALFTLQGANGPVGSVGDVDGDGVSDIVAEVRRALVLHAGGTGAPLRTLAEIGVDTSSWQLRHAGPTWAVGPDLDGDGVRDLAVLVRADAGLALRVVSGRDGAALRSAPVSDGRLQALAWFGDVDGDGVPELAAVDAAESSVVAYSGATGALLWSAMLPASSRYAARLQNVHDRNGDGSDDLLLDVGPSDLGQSVWISGRDGALFADPLGAGGLFTALGDLDGDGLGDVADGGLHGGMGGNVITLRTTTGAHPWKRTRTPDLAPDWPALCAVGDLDGDGCPDLALGDTNFHLRGPEEDPGATAPLDLSALTLEQALALPSNPYSVAQESGCVHVRSGRDGAVLMAVFGEPGTHAGVGEWVFVVDDQSGDGVPDLAVSIGGSVAVFATRAPSSDPFEWLPGRWVREVERDGVVRVSEELWLAPAAGRMLGLNQSYARGAESGGSFEFLRLEREGEALTFVAQPGGAPPTRFVATEVGPRRVLFTNPQHDFPTRILYAREGDTLRAEVGTDAEPAQLRCEWRLGGAR